MLVFRRSERKRRGRVDKRSKRDEVNGEGERGREEGGGGRKEIPSIGTALCHLLATEAGAVVQTESTSLQSKILANKIYITKK